LTLTLKKNSFFKLFYYIHIVEIPTNKGANSYKLKISKIGNMPTFMTLKHYDAQLTNYGEPVGTCAILLD